MVIKSTENMTRRFSKSWIFIAVIILFIVFVRVRLSEVPFERDEGEYAYMGQLLLQGIPPYSAAYNMKFPGTYAGYALIMSLFGQSVQGVHLGFMIMNCATVLLIFYLGRRIMSDFGAVIASGTYAVLSLSPSVLGFAAHATHFVVLPAVAGALLLLNAEEKNKPLGYFLSGMMFSLAIIMKQPGLFFLLFGALYIVSRHFSLKRKHPLKETVFNLAAFMSGSLVPLLATLVWLYTAGVFGKFWFWTVEYAARYGTQIPLSRAFTIFRNNFYSVADGFFILWTISFLGLIALLFHRGLKVSRGFIVLFFVFSFLSVCPGFYFRAHYFITFLPAVAVSAGIFADYFATATASFSGSKYARFIVSGVFIAAALVGVVDQKEYFFMEEPARVSRSVYGLNPFPESEEIARFIEARTSESDKIAVIGSEPQIYFYSKRHSATGYIYTYGLMENHPYSLLMQKEMIHEIETSSPKIILVVDVYTSWLMRPDSERYMFGWLDNYIQKNYDLVGIADIISPDRTVYKWNDQAKTYSIRGEAHILVFERR